MNASIVLVSERDSDSHALAQKIGPLRDGFQDLRVLVARLSWLPRVLDEQVSLVVLNYGDWTDACLSTIEEIKDLSYEGPILVLANSNAGAAEGERSLERFPKVGFMEKPFDSRELRGVVRRILLTPSIANRVHQRHATYDSAEIEFLEREDRHSSRVCNLSRGGAYLGLFHSASVRVGERLLLRLRILKTKVVYTVTARVAWVTSTSPAGGPGIGVEFIDAGDVTTALFG